MSMLTKTREASRAAPLGAGLLSREADFRTLAEAIAGPIFISQGNRLQYVNHAAEIVTGYTREQLLSMNFWDTTVIKMVQVGYFTFSNIFSQITKPG